VGHIEKRHVLAYKDQMMADRAAPATINKHLAALGSLLQLAVDNDLWEANVAKGIRVRGSRVSDESRLPYDKQDLKQIFSRSVEQGRPRSGCRRWRCSQAPVWSSWGRRARRT
jgi:hypothetical protein